MTWSELEAERHDREDALGRALRALPPSRAPHTLAPRVMAAVQARLGLRVARTWFDWSAWAQMASVMAFVVAVAGVAMLWPLVNGALDRVVSVDGVRVVTVLFRALWQPLVSWLVLGMTITALLCATCGALLHRIALGGASR